MQHKGLVRIFAIALAIVCVFYLSFSVVTNIYSNRAEQYAGGDKMKEYFYLDSIGSEKVWLGYTLKQCREKELNLGLDLKGGMNIVLEVSVPDILKALSGYNTSENFTKAIELASERQKTNSQRTYLDLFVDAYKELDPQAKLATVFSTYDLKDRIQLSTSNEEVVKVLRGEIDAAVANSFNVLRTRIDRFGVVQPNLQRLGNTGRILIELPGVKEPERVRKLLQGSANLEFWETYDFAEIYQSFVQANTVLASLQTKETVKIDNTTQTTTAAVADTAKTDAPLSKIDSLKLAVQSEEGAKAAADSTQSIEKFKKENPLFAVIQLNVGQGGQVGMGPVIGYVEARDTAKVNAYLNMKQVKELFPRELGLRWTVKPYSYKDSKGKEIETNSYQLIAIKITSRDGRARLTGSVVTDARADFRQGSAASEVSMTMNTEGAREWARITKENLKKSVAIALDGYIYSFPTVQSEITGGQSNITGNFTVEEAKDLANTLKSGKMPAPAKIVQEEVIGPSLGAAAIESGLWSFVVAFVLVLLFMIFYYGLIPGLIADLALFINVFFLVGILASFGTVLTLPGIAGIVLTLGMAVDGNVLIYERIREEKESGKSQLRAIQDGYKKAISAIIDANVTSLLVGIILWIFGQGPVFGFAVTLVWGIVTSFFTSVFLTRMFLEMYARREKAKDITFTTKFTERWFKNAKYKFIENRKKAYIGSLITIGICVVSLVGQGVSWGVDFTGGRNYVVKFDSAVNTEDVRELLQEAYGEGNSPLVISFGSDSQVRITTKYKANEDGDVVDKEIRTVLYEHLKPMLAEGTTYEQFDDIYIQSSTKVGPTIADDLKTSSIWAVVLSLLAISLYIFIRFNDFAFSLGTLICLAHDTIIIIGLYSLLYKFMPFSMEIDQAFMAALLTYLGYSVNDTVVIFDRIRENVGLFPKRSKSEIMNESLNETLSRTFSTSTSVLLVMLAMFLFGGETVQGFIFALLVGSILGVYSTLYVAVPVAFDVMEIKRKKKEAKAALK